MGIRKIDFSGIAQAALNQALPLLQSWLPEGRKSGVEYKAKNPRRADKSVGSFTINTQSTAPQFPGPPGGGNGWNEKMRS
jgi:hypothetical protein